MNFDDVSNYIQNLYKQKEVLTQKEYTFDMRVKDYIPTVDDETAAFLLLIIHLVKPKHILEIGTSVGFSTVSMALAAKPFGGKITTIEFDETVAAQAQENFEKSGTADSITLLHGDAAEILQQLQGSYDIIFQDVDKRLYSRLLPNCLRLLASDGLLLSDDALFPILDLDKRWENQIAPVRSYNELLMRTPELESVLLPVGDGLMLSRKTEAA